MLSKEIEALKATLKNAEARAKAAEVRAATAVKVAVEAVEAKAHLWATSHLIAFAAGAFVIGLFVGLAF